MASASDKNASPSQEEDELEGLFNTFDHQLKDVQQKITAMEQTLQEFRSSAVADEDTAPDTEG